MSRDEAGGPGYSALPQMQRVTSSDSTSSSSSTLRVAFALSSFSLVLLRLLRRVAGGSLGLGRSGSSRDSDLLVTDS